MGEISPRYEIGIDFLTFVDFMRSKVMKSAIFCISLVCAPESTKLIWMDYFEIWYICRLVMAKRWQGRKLGLIKKIQNDLVFHCWDIIIGYVLHIDLYICMPCYCRYYCKMINYWRRFIWRNWRNNKFHQN